MRQQTSVLKRKMDKLICHFFVHRNPSRYIFVRRIPLMASALKVSRQTLVATYGGGLNGSWSPSSHRSRSQQVRLVPGYLPTARRGECQRDNHSSCLETIITLLPIYPSRSPTSFYLSSLSLFPWATNTRKRALRGRHSKAVSVKWLCTSICWRLAHVFNYKRSLSIKLIKCF